MKTFPTASSIQIMEYLTDNYGVKLQKILYVSAVYEMFYMKIFSKEQTKRLCDDLTREPGWVHNTAQDIWNVFIHDDGGMIEIFDHSSEGWYGISVYGKKVDIDYKSD